MEWAILAIAVVGILLAYVVWQGTRASLKYRELAEGGDIPTIRLIVEEAIEEWRSGRPPKDLPPSVWRGVQAMELMDVGPDYIRVSCDAEGHYKLVDGVWQEVKSPLEEGIAITAKAADMLLYELPNLKLDRAQIDVYTTYRDTAGASRQCILTCTARRQDAREVDWESWTAEEIVQRLGARYRLDENGQVLPVTPDESAVAPASGGDKPTVE